MSEAKVDTLLRGVPQKSTDIPYHWKRGFGCVNVLYYSIQIGIKKIPPGVFGKPAGFKNATDFTRQKFQKITP